MVPSAGPTTAKVMLVGESPGEEELRRREPFVGASGQELNRMLHEAGIMRSQCFTTNVCRERPPGNDIMEWISAGKRCPDPAWHPMGNKWVHPHIRDGAAMLWKEIELVNPNIIIAFGNVALWTLTDRWGIKSWRGSLLQARGAKKVIPTYHPAYVLRDWATRAITVNDLKRAARQSLSPGMPQSVYNFVIRPSFETAANCLQDMIDGLNDIAGADSSSLSPEVSCRRGRMLDMDCSTLSWGLRDTTQNRQKPNLCTQSSLGNASGPNPKRPPDSAHLPTQELCQPSSPENSNTSGEREGQALATISPALDTSPNTVSNLSSQEARNDMSSSSSTGVSSNSPNSVLNNSPFISRRKTLSVDIETRAGHIACIGIGWSSKEALCIPLMCIEDDTGYWREEEEVAIVSLLQRVLCHPTVEVVGQNFIYDTQYVYRHWRFVPRFVRDTMLGHHVCFPGTPKGLDYLSSMYAELHIYWKAEGKTWDRHTGEEQLWSYNCKDCVITYECDEAIQDTVNILGLRAAHDFQQQMFWPVLEAMVRGVRVDTDRRASFAKELSEEITARECWFQSILGHPLNPRSPLQMKRLFYEDLKQKEVFNRKTGTVTLNDEALQKMALREPLLRPLVQRISEHRTLGVFNSTFVGARLDSDQRLRCSYNIAGTETFRLSSSTNAFDSGLNLQNIPKGGGEDELQLPNVRKLFVPDEGYTFFDADLDRADLQVVVWEADDAELRAMLLEGVDIHSENAALLGISRQLAKTWVHGTNYGGSPRTMATNSGLSIHQAEKMRARWFSAHPGIARWHVRTANDLRTRRTVKNKWGYRRFYFDRIDSILPEALAWIPQSTVAITINRIWKLIYDTLPAVQVLLQVHDSLAGQFPTTLAAECRAGITAAARSVSVPYDLPLCIPLGIKTSETSWGDCV